MKLSVALITLNEEKNLKNTLESVCAIADEIIIIDSGSTDKTIEIAQQYNAKTLFQQWEDMVNRKTSHCLNVRVIGYY